MAGRSLDIPLLGVVDEQYGMVEERLGFFGRAAGAALTRRAPFAPPRVPLEDELLMSPWHKWRAYRRPPFQLIAHVLLLVVATPVAMYAEWQKVSFLHDMRLELVQLYFPARCRPACAETGRRAGGAPRCDLPPPCAFSRVDDVLAFVGDAVESYYGAQQALVSRVEYIRAAADGARPGAIEPVRMEALFARARDDADDAAADPLAGAQTYALRLGEGAARFGPLLGLPQLNISRRQVFDRLLALELTVRFVSVEYDELYDGPARTPDQPPAPRARQRFGAVVEHDEPDDTRAQPPPDSRARRERDADRARAAHGASRRSARAKSGALNLLYPPGPLAWSYRLALVPSSGRQLLELRTELRVELVVREDAARRGLGAWLRTPAFAAWLAIGLLALALLCLALRSIALAVQRLRLLDEAVVAVQARKRAAGTHPARAAALAASPASAASPRLAALLPRVACSPLQRMSSATMRTAATAAGGSHAQPWPLPPSPLPPPTLIAVAFGRAAAEAAAAAAEAEAAAAEAAALAGFGSGSADDGDDGGAGAPGGDEALAAAKWASRVWCSRLFRLLSVHHVLLALGSAALAAAAAERLRAQLHAVASLAIAERGWHSAAVAVGLGACWVAITRYYEWAPQLYLFTHTLRRAARSTATLMTAVAPVFVAYAASGTALFSDATAAFAGFSTSCVTLWAMCAGDEVNETFRQVYAARPFVGRLYAYSFTAVFYFTCANIFVFLIEAAHHAALRDIYDASGHEAIRRLLDRDDDSGAEGSGAAPAPPPAHATAGGYRPPTPTSIAQPTTGRDGADGAQPLATPSDRLERIEGLLAELLRAQREAAPSGI
jgi:hypothetical protein